MNRFSNAEKRWQFGINQAGTRTNIMGLLPHELAVIQRKVVEL